VRRPFEVSKTADTAARDASEYHANQTDNVGRWFAFFVPVSCRNQEDTVGKPAEDTSSIPNLDRAAVVARLHELGLTFVTERTITTATYARKLRRHLVAGKTRYSLADVMAWLESTREAEYLDRRNVEAS
jgi:hypothetical protein